MKCEKCLVACIGICLCCNLYFEGLHESPATLDHTHENYPTAQYTRMTITAASSTAVSSTASTVYL